MRCPECSWKDYYSGIMGPNCLNPRCSKFQNGQARGQTAAVAAPPTGEYVGWIWIAAGAPLPKEDYIFRSEASAERWVKMIGISHFADRPRRVRTNEPIVWQDDPRGAGAVMADRMYIICEAYEDQFGWKGNSNQNFAVVDER